MVYYYSINKYCIIFFFKVTLSEKNVHTESRTVFMFYVSTHWDLFKLKI